MTESKGTMIGIRVSGEEKELLTDEANKLGLSLSQYIRYRALEDDAVNREGTQKTPEEFLDKHIARIARLIVDSWVHIKAMSLNNLSEAQKDNAHAAAIREIKKMGVAKWEEEYGERTPKDTKNK